jgi:hypothetical protein
MKTKTPKEGAYTEHYSNGQKKLEGCYEKQNTHQTTTSNRIDQIRILSTQIRINNRRNKCAMY